MSNQKAEIVIIGTFNDEGQPVGWHFDHSEVPKTPAFDIQDDGSIIYSGYTVDELREITSQDAVVH